VAAAVLEAAVATRKPVVACLLGYAGKTPDGVRTAITLEEAAVTAVGLAGREVAALARPQAAPAGARGAIRGLYSGGTLCDEAQRIVGSVQHRFTDYGGEEFTRGRPHPIIDPGRRNAALVEAGDDPDVSVVLLDLVLGDCAHPDPAGSLRPALNEARARRRGRALAVVAHVVGTDQDPQGLEKQEQALRDLGAIVCASNRIAAETARALAGGGHGA
jgi:succinyl-CoA synthetase alpha subunit